MSPLLPALSRILVCLSAAAAIDCLAADADLRERARTAAKRATAFLTDQVATEGGYLWKYSADLSLKEGEGQVETPTIWVQPPGTPSVGGAFVNLYEATGDRQFLSAAWKAGDALRRGQMRSGGWQAMIEFDPQRRARWDYRVNPPRRKAKDQSSLDDDKTQSALRFVMMLDRAMDFRDPAVHEMAMYGLRHLIERGQLPNGGFPQVWTGEEYDAGEQTEKHANYPQSWPRKYPGHRQYWEQYTLNDNLAFDVFQTLRLADEIYGGRGSDSPYEDAAIKLGDFLLLAQMPDPQPAWAQQYNYEMQPIWARKFEPPSITGGESQGVVQTLLRLYAWTGKRKYLEPIPRALDYLERSELPNGRLARFYELESNRPLYFTRDYELTYENDDVPTHYSFDVPSNIGQLRKQYNQVKDLDGAELAEFYDRSNGVREKRVRQVVDALDDRGAWVSQEPMRYHPHPGPVIDMREMVANLNLLATYLARRAD